MSSFWTGRLTAVKVIGRYLWLTVWPARLSIDYSYSEIPLSTGAVEDWLACAILAAMILMTAALYRYHRTTYFFAAFAAVTFIPMANLLFPIGSIMADRFLYLPSFGLLGVATLAIFGLGERLRSPALAPVVLSLIVTGFAARTWMRNLDWKDELALVTAGVRTSPQSYKVHKVLASVLYASGSFETNLARTTQEAEKALAILDPLPDALNEPDTYRWSGGFYLAKGDLLRKRGVDASQAYERARSVLLRCIAIDNALEEHRNKESRSNSTAIASSKPEAYRLLSAVYLRLGDSRKAGETISLARSMDPTAPEAYRQAAEVSLAEGNPEEAAVMLMSGVLITSNEGVRQDLLSLYRSGVDTTGCAIANGPNGPVMNPACGTVRRHVCAAAVNAINAALHRGRQDLALAQKQNFIRNFGCRDEALR